MSVEIRVRPRWKRALMFPWLVCGLRRFGLSWYWAFRCTVDTIRWDVRLR